MRRSFLLVIVGTYLVAAAATLGAFWWSVSRTTMSYVERYSVAENELEKNLISSILNRELALSLKMVDDPLIKDWMRRGGAPPAEGPLATELESYRRLFRDGTYFVAIASSLDYFAHTPATKGLEHTVLRAGNPGDRWFFDSLARSQDYWINVNYDALLDEIRVWINALVRDGSRPPLGVAGEGLNIGEFLAKLVDHAEPGISTIIVDSQGAILAHRDRSIIERNAHVSKDADKITILQELPDPADRRRLAEAMAAARAGGADAVRTLTIRYGGRAMTASVGYLPELDWNTLILVDGSSIIGPASFIAVILVFLVTLSLVLGMIIILLNRLVLSPLFRLNAAAETIAGGAYDIALPIGPANEIGRLSASFNQMSAKVRDYTDNLERLVEERTKELNEANKALSESRSRLVDSIQYGKLIQNSILPALRETTEELGEFFVLLRPLDTVGGDFCFFRPVAGGFCIAAVDCTGHGVPGAFMTMMVNALLNQVIDTLPGRGPAELLERLDLLVQDTLRAETDTEHLQNGLDIALCVVNAGERILEFAGAGLPLFVAEGAALRELRGDRVHLGFSTPRKKPALTNHRLAMPKGARYYLLSDGVLDLPGGPKGHGLGRKGVTDILRSLRDQPLAEHERIVGETLDRYRGALAPKDDMLLLGFSLDKPEES